MTSIPSPKAASSRRSRKSIAHFPTSDLVFNKENTEHGTSSTVAVEKVAGKKPRSKSLGPGELDALMQDAGNKQKIPFTVKSILKPTIVISPPKQIPPRANSRKSSPGKGSPGKARPGTSPRKNGSSSPLKGTSRPDSTRQSGTETLTNPFDDPTIKISAENDSSQETRVSLRTEEEQQAAAKEKELQEGIERRDARRKSLANRRVSFAPEATLHTWDVVELAEDATTSSEATNSTRRASSGSTLSASPFAQPNTQPPTPDPLELPSTPTEQVEEVQVAASPAHQRDVHQKKRRRSSAIPPMDFNNPDDLSSSPSSMLSDETDNQPLVTVDDDLDSSDSDKDFVELESPPSIVDADDTTIRSVASALSAAGSSTSSSDRLEASLRQAAEQAGTQGIEYDEHGDMTMDMAEDETNHGAAKLQDVRNLTAMLDQENVNPFSPAFKAKLDNKTEETIQQEQTMDMTQAVGEIQAIHVSPGFRGQSHDSTKEIIEQDQTMEMTQAVGQILPKRSPKRARKSVAVKPCRVKNSRRRSSGDTSTLDDETMEFTTALGTIQPSQPVQQTDAADSADENEELTMEFTTVVGGVMSKKDTLETSKSSSTERKDNFGQHVQFNSNRRVSMSSNFDEEEMEMTMAVGDILPSITERTEPDEDQTAGMDITTAIGAILPNSLNTQDKVIAKLLMEEEAEHGQLTRSPFDKKQSKDGGLIAHTAITTSESGSPSLATVQSRNARRSTGPRPSVTPKTVSRHSSPLKKPTTPSRQITPQAERPSTPGKTPPAKNVSMRMASPKRLFKAEIRKAASTTPTSAVPSLEFSENVTTGVSTPSIVLKPKSRRSSGIGIDKTGLGSPRVAALLDRRASIGEASTEFTPQSRPTLGVRFEDPRVLEQEIDNERAADKRRESGRGILQMEADVQEKEKDVTANLKDKILSLTPKKSKLKGRKSLHVGAAKGLLGKRPVELDEDEDDDPSPKRLKGMERSPVKNIKLPAPPPKDETISKLKNPPKFVLAESSGNGQASTPKMHNFPGSIDKPTTPQNHKRFKDTELVLSAAKPPATFDERLAGVSATSKAAAEEPEERIHLQDFLNLTSIRFMELTTTKRRHTIAPTSSDDSLRSAGQQPGGDEQSDQGRELEACVVAGACTMPMLELYQHSCRELKNYIAEGRSIVQEIEDDTFEENPPLFREYLSAPPEVRSIMDNQFKNVKTHARLLSKAMWYEWRTKLLDGLKDHLLQIGDGFTADDEILTQQEQLLNVALPPLIEEHDALAAEAQLLQAQADELASCNQEELTEARKKLAAVDEEVEAKTKIVSELQKKLKTEEDRIEQITERKQDCLAEIQEAERVREQYRGWSEPEVAALKAKVDALEETYGWIITSVSGSALTLTYRGVLQLFLTPSSFRKNGSEESPAEAENSPISLTYIADTHEYHPVPLITEKRFFLQIMRARLQCLQQSQTQIKEVLGFVCEAWTQACRVAEQSRQLNLTHITETSIRSDDVLALRSMILLRDMRTKVDVVFEVQVEEGKLDIQLDITPHVKLVYGEKMSEGKIAQSLRQKVGGRTEIAGWATAVRQLEGRLVAKGKKIVL